MKATPGVGKGPTMRVSTPMLAEAGDEGVFEHIAGEAGVFADDDSVFTVMLAEQFTGRTT